MHRLAALGRGLAITARRPAAAEGAEVDEKVLKSTKVKSMIKVIGTVVTRRMMIVNHIERFVVAAM